MKPRTIIAETTLPGGAVLALQEHDGRRYLVSDGVQTAGPATRASEREMARLGCAPFRPARQPKILLAGLALGEALAGVTEALPQKRATFIVAEPLDDLVAWHREHFPESPLVTDQRVVRQNDVGIAGLTAHQGTLHAVLLHADTAPPGPDGRPLLDDRRWLTAAYDALQPGGLLVIASSTRFPQIDRTLARAGFKVVESDIEAVPNARRPKRHFLWLARKGTPSD